MELPASSHEVATCRIASISPCQRITSAAPRFPGTKRCHIAVHDARCLAADLLLHMWRVNALEQRNCRFCIQQVAVITPYSAEKRTVCPCVSPVRLCA